MAVGSAVSLVRLATGLRNVARPLEFLNALVWIVAGFWFFTVFPFDFTRLADALPSSLRFLLSWVPNWLGKATILIAGLAGVGNAIYLPVLYVSVRRGLAKRAPSTS